MARWPLVALYTLLVALVVALMAIGAHAAQLNNCSQTVGASAAAVPFPAAGATGPASPQNYLEICNAHATNTLGINFSGGTAAIGSTGTLTLNPGGCMWWDHSSIPTALSAIGSAGSTTTACGYQ
jgi:hypothetical protein